MPIIILIVVLLPEPFGPIKPNVLPGLTESERLSTARALPNRFVKPVSSMASSVLMFTALVLMPQLPFLDDSSRAAVKRLRTSFTDMPAARPLRMPSLSARCTACLALVCAAAFPFSATNSPLPRRE